MKTVIITGASRGIGRALAIKFKQKNYNVIGTYLNSYDDATYLKNNYGIDMRRLNVSNFNDVNSFFDSVIKDYFKIDIVFNNAGVSKGQKFIADVTESEFDDIVSTNFKGAFNVLRKSVETMLYNGGKIINTSSIYTLKGGSCEAVYTATKYALNGLTKSVSEEISSSKLQVATAILGLIDTDMNKNLTMDEKLEFIKGIGLSEIPTANDVAEEIFKLVTEELDVNGKEFKIFTGNM